MCAGGDWLILGRPLAAVKGAPDRAAFWLGFLAAKAWRTTNSMAQLGELLGLTPAECFAGLR